MAYNPSMNVEILHDDDMKMFFMTMIPCREAGSIYAIAARPHDHAMWLSMRPTNPQSGWGEKSTNW